MNPAHTRKKTIWGLRGNTKRHWSFGGFGHLPTIQDKHTFLWSKATPILPRSNHPSPNRGWVAQPRHQFPQAEKAQQRKPLRSQRLRLKLPKVLDWNDVHPRKLTWKRYNSLKKWQFLVFMLDFWGVRTYGKMSFKKQTCEMTMTALWLQKTFSFNAQICVTTKKNKTKKHGKSCKKMDQQIQNTIKQILSSSYRFQKNFAFQIVVPQLSDTQFMHVLLQKPGIHVPHANALILDPRLLKAQGIKEATGKGHREVEKQEKSNPALCFFNAKNITCSNQKKKYHEKCSKSPHLHSSRILVLGRCHLDPSFTTGFGSHSGSVVNFMTYRISLSTIHPKKTGVISHWNIACASGSVSASHHHPHPKSRNQELNFRPKNHVNLKQTRCTLMIVLMHVGRLKQIHLKNCSMIVIDHQEAYYFHLFSDMFSDIHQKVTCVWYTVFMSTKNLICQFVLQSCHSSNLIQTPPFPLLISTSFVPCLATRHQTWIIRCRWWWGWQRRHRCLVGIQGLFLGRFNWPSHLSPVEGLIGSEIRLTPEVVEIPCFTRFQKHPRWLAGFLPSTGPRKSFKVWKFNKHRLYKWLGGKGGCDALPGGVLWSETIRNKVGRFCAARCFPFIVHLKNTSHNFTCLIMFEAKTTKIPNSQLVQRKIWHINHRLTQGLRLFFPLQISSHLNQAFGPSTPFTHIEVPS